MQTPQGPIVTWEGKRLHSSRDPEREARRWARGLELGESTMVVALGYGSGYGIQAIRQRTEAPIVVFEPNEAVLREGLGHVPVPDGILILTDIERLSVYLSGVLQGFDRGLVATWTPSLRTAPREYREALTATAEAVGRAKLRHQTAVIRGPGWLRHFLTNLERVTADPPLSSVRHGLAGVPAIVVAAGPSLDRNIDVLKTLPDTALILAVNTSARALARKGIRPHALVSIESADITSGLAELPWLAEVPAFLELTAHPRMWEMPFPTKIAMAVDTSGSATFSQAMDPGLAVSAGFCVANAAVAIAEALGCNPIILIGSDLSYSEGRVYASGTIFEDMRAVPEGDGVVRFCGTDARKVIEAASSDALSSNRAPDTAVTLRVPAYGNVDESVSTTPDFKMFRDWYTYAAERMTVELVNATEGGVHIPGWLHEPLASVAKRHGLNTPSLGMPVTRRFADLLERPPLSPVQVQDAVARELADVTQLLDFCREAMSIVGFDPDGDLTIDEASAERITAINAGVRATLKRAPLAGEACFSPIQQVRSRGELTTYAFYAALEGPLQELAEELARLVQNLSSQHDAARETKSRSA